MKRLCVTVLALLAFTPAMAAPTTFWTFGFYFPDRAHNHAGGFSRLDHGEAPPAAAPVELAGLDTPFQRLSYSTGGVAPVISDADAPASNKLKNAVPVHKHVILALVYDNSVTDYSVRSSVVR